MIHLKKSTLIIFAALMIASLSACTIGQAAEPTPTAVDINAVMTSAAATAFVEMTNIAAAAPPTLTPTIPPTQTPTNTLETAASQTQAGVILPSATLMLAGNTPVVPNLPGTTVQPSLTPIVAIPPGNTDQVCYKATFVADMTVPDGTVMSPGQKFYKIWRLKNDGLCTWDEGFQFVLWTGTSMNSRPYYFPKGKYIKPGEVVDIGIEMRAPYEPNDYVAHWTMMNDQGKTFPNDFTVVIKVVK